ncbi:protein kinase, partial [Acinetobacter baumannii]
QVVDVKVSDFGSALNLHADSTQIHRVGSLAYMPPEQIEGGDVDCRADIYALGAVLYHLISGRAPFDASHQMALMHQIYHQPPLPLVGQ